MNAPMACEWTDVEQAFFEAAPPDEPEAPVGFEPASTKTGRILGRGARGWKTWVVLATGTVLVGLSAVVFAAQ